jgi:phosphoglycerol transferase MdoB-like AlkP superfamily enzyme
MTVRLFNSLNRFNSGYLTTILTFVSRFWLLILQLSTVLLLAYLIFRVANWEPFTGGVIAVFLLLALPSAALLCVSGHTSSIAISIGGSLLLMEAANSKKMELLSEHLHLVDLLSLWEYTKGGNFMLLAQYHELVIRVVLLLCLFILVVFLLRFIEKKGFRSSVHWSGYRPAFVILGITAGINAFLFVNGNYFWAMSKQFVYSRVSWSTGPLRVSDFLASGVDLVSIERELGSTKVKSSPNAFTSAAGAVCSNCPDIITVHVESVFDPNILRNYADIPRVTDFLNPRLVSLNGPLKTYVMGGWSLLSEFSFNCGLDHRIFGASGLFPNLFLPKAIKRCIPGYLRDNGYKTAIVSSAPYEAHRIGDTYKAYGVEQFSGPETFPVPLTWSQMRDGFFVDAAIERLKESRTAPRLLVLLTTFNHGPHGEASHEIFPGPYDLSRAESDDLRDYMNRLNDTLTAFRRLEEFIEASSVPTVIIYYGDHQPNMKLDFSPEAIHRFGKEDINHVTFYRVARNFQSIDSPENGRYLGIDQLYGEGLAFGGIRLPPELQLKERIARSCPRGILACSERAAMRAIILK